MEQNGSQGIQKENEDGWVEVQKPTLQLVLTKYISKLPYPQRQQRSKLDQRFQDFLNIFRKLTINIPLAEAFEQMSRYAKFMKQTLSKKKKFKEFKTIALNAEFGVVLQSKLPLKLKDQRRFIIPDGSQQLCIENRMLNYVTM